MIPFKDPEKKRAHSAAWRAAHREEKRAYDAAWRAAHREEKRAYDAAWRAAHREEQRAYEAARWATPEYRQYKRQYKRARRAAVSREATRHMVSLLPVGDGRSRIEKLQMMANQTASPLEAAIAREKLVQLGVQTSVTTAD